jgi:hypothetical protein
MALRLGAFAAENAPLLEEEAMVAARLLSRAGRGAARFGRAGYRAAARAAGKAYRVAQRNPFTAGMVAQSALDRASRRVGKKKKRTLSRPLGPVKRRKTTFKPTSGFHVSDTSLPFRKGRRPNLSTKFLKRNYDDYGSIQRNHSLWVQFQTHGCRERIMQIASEALLRALLSRVDYYPSVFEQEFPDNGTLQMLRIRWNATNLDGSSSSIDKDYTLGGQTFEQVANAIRSQWEFTDQTTYQGCPIRATFFRNDNTSASNTTLRAIREIEDVDKMKLMLYSSQSVRVQNLTPNDAGSTSLDVAGTNPVQGKIYEFTTAPRLREQINEKYSDIRGLQDHFDGDGVRWLDNTTSTGVDGVIGHPPPAGGLFTNCRKVANVSIGAGMQKHKNTLFTFKGTVLQFSQKFRLMYVGADSTAYKKHGGGCIWLALEQKFRAGPDVIKIGFNRELSMMGRCEFARKRPMLRHYEQTDIGDIID